VSGLPFEAAQRVRASLRIPLAQQAQSGLRSGEEARYHHDFLCSGFGMGRAMPSFRWLIRDGSGRRW
jgi:hypothetical protein